MFEDRGQSGATSSDGVESSSHGPGRDPGKSPRTGALQLKAAASGAGGSMATAETGFAGAPMDLPYRAEMESGFGTSFAGVQAHGGAEAQAANAALGSRAYAVGNQIAFDNPAPAKEVVAHELAHTIQQSGGSSSSTALQPWTLGGGDPFEAEADAAAGAIMSGQPAAVGLRGPTGVKMWGGGDHYTIGNLAGQKAQQHLAGIGIATPSAPTIIQATPGTGPSTAGAADPSSQGLAASGTSVNTRPGGSSLGVQTDAGTISFGAASRYGGDYATTVNGIGGLSGRGDELSGAGQGRRTDPNASIIDRAKAQGLNAVQFAQMTMGGTTNANHFYPVNGMEYRNHHNLAMGHARQAAALSNAGDAAAATEEIRQAMQEEGFANHFLQDTFSAGHMAPRSLDSTEHLVQDPNALHLAMHNTGQSIDRTAQSVGATVGNAVGNVTGFFTGAWNTVSSFTNPFSEEGRTQIAREMQNQAQNTATTMGHSAQQASNAVTGTFQQGGLVNQGTRAVQQLPGTYDDAVQGLMRTKQWHDFFCALPGGIATTRGNFHGDYMMDGNDLAVVSDTAANSIVQVMSVAHNKGEAPPVEIPTPNVSAILADPMAGPAWRMMMSDYEQSLRAAKASLAQNPNATTTTDGGTTVPSSEVLALIEANIFNGESGARQSPEESRAAAQAQAQVDPSGQLPRLRGFITGSLDTIEYYLMSQFGFTANLGVDDNLNAPVETESKTGGSVEDKTKHGSDIVSDGSTGPAFDPCQLEGKFRLLSTLQQQINDYQAGLGGAMQNAQFSRSYQAVIRTEQEMCTAVMAKALEWKSQLDALMAAGTLSFGAPVGLPGGDANQIAWGAGHPEFISNHVARRAYRQTMQGQIRPMRDQLRDQAPSWGRGAGAAAQHAAGPAR